MASPSDVADDMLDAVVRSLATERTIDIVTTGRRSGAPRTTEIWTTLVAGDLYICGTPGADQVQDGRSPRDWLANLLADPAFTVRLKSSVRLELAARASEVTDRAERRRLLAAPQSAYYREYSASAEAFVDHAPVVSVEFTGEWAAVSDALRAARVDGPT